MKKLAVFLGGMLLASWAPAAYGAIQISFSVNGGAAAICATSAISTGPITCSASGGGATIQTLSANSNSPGTPGLSQTFGSVLQITSTNAVTLDVWIAAQGFTTPLAPPSVKFSGSASTTSTTGIGTVAVSHCVDTSNGLPPPTTAFCSTGFTLPNPIENYGPGASSDSQTSSLLISSLSAPYSLGEHITLTLGANSNLNVITSSVLTPVPEPMSIALLGGVLILTSGAIRRKRNQAAKV